MTGNGEVREVVNRREGREKALKRNRAPDREGTMLLRYAFFINRACVLCVLKIKSHDHKVEEA